MKKQKRPGKPKWPWPVTLALWLALALLAAFIVSVLLPRSSHAHDHWISRGGFKNTAGEWCCGAYDCRAYHQTVSSALGWIIETGELVPFDEALPFAPPDGSKLTICRRPDGSRRCVFGVKPGL